MQRYGVRPSVRLSVCPIYRLWQQYAAGFLLWAWRAGRRYRSLAAWPAPQQHGPAARRSAANADSAKSLPLSKLCLRRYGPVPRRHTAANIPRCFSGEFCKSPEWKRARSGSFWLDLSVSISDGLLCTKLAIFICRAAPPRCDGSGNPDPLRMVPFADAVAVSSVVFSRAIWPCVCLCLSVTLPKRVDKSCWFLTGKLRLTSPALC